jgi:hypothetical protein
MEPRPESGTNILIERTVGGRGIAANRPLFTIVPHTLVVWVLAALTVPLMVTAWYALVADEPNPRQTVFLMFAIAFALALIVLAAQWLVSSARQRRRVREVRGETLVQYARFGDDRIALGVRGVYELSYDPAILARVRLTRHVVEITLSNARIYVYRRHFTPGQAAEVQRFVRRRWGDGKDACPACGYDLRGTPGGAGATCPECGAVVQAEAAAESP